MTLLKRRPTFGLKGLLHNGVVGIFFWEKAFHAKDITDQHGISLHISNGND